MYVTNLNCIPFIQLLIHNGISFEASAGLFVLSPEGVPPVRFTPFLHNIKTKQQWLNI